MNELIKTAPEKIYLCVSDDESSRDEPFPYYCSEVTWSEHQSVCVTIEYVRSDKVIDDETRQRTLDFVRWIASLKTGGLIQARANDILKLLEAGNGE